ncbi:MAG: ABC transporter substrate-binding protein [Eubacteriaceae bacterium]|nr:ABC transporter substrate-binding protein [Eubacteriaceae bacterium]
MKRFKKGFIILLVISLVLLWGGCSNTKTDTGSGDPETTAYPLTITDDLGNKVTIESEPTKIVSIAPSNTEILFALGLGDMVVGRTDYCNFPEEALDVQSVGSFSEPNTELIIELAPEVIFAQRSIPEETKTLLEGSGIKVIIFNPNDIDAILTDINIVGQVCNVQDAAKELTDSMQTEREALVKKLADVESKKVFMDLGSFYTVGKVSFMSSIIVELKAENIAADLEGDYPQVTLEKIIEADPDAYISTGTSLEELNAIEGLDSIAAFKNKNVTVIPWGTNDNDIVQRPGPRVIKGMEIYAKAIYPEVFK